jgi:hypothetical protein
MTPGAVNRAGAPGGRASDPADGPVPSDMRGIASAHASVYVRTRLASQIRRRIPLHPHDPPGCAGPRRSPLDVMACPRCGSRMSVIAVIVKPTHIRRIIACLDRHGRGPPPPQSADRLQHVSLRGARLPQQQHIRPEHPSTHACAEWASREGDQAFDCNGSAMRRGSGPRAG